MVRGLGLAWLAALAVAVCAVGLIALFDQQHGLRFSRPSDAWAALGWVLDPPASLEITPGEPRISQREAVARALHADPSNHTLWFGLGTVLQQGQQELIRGVNVSKIAAFVEALLIRPTHEPSWFHLGEALSKNDSVRIGEQKITRIDAFARALELNNRTLATWGFLGSTLNATERVTVGSRLVGRKECFRQVVSIDEQHAIGWLNLGTELVGDELISVNGRNYTQKDCFIMSLRSNPKGIAGAWFNLGMVLSPGENVTIWPGVAETLIKDRTECFVRAVTISHRTPPAWFALAESLPPRSSIDVLGKSRSRADCYARAAYLDGANGTIWARLLEEMAEDDTVEVTPGDPPLTKTECIARRRAVVP